MRDRADSPDCATVFWWDVAPDAEDVVDRDPIRDVRTGYLQLSSSCVGLCLACEDAPRRPSPADYRAAVRGVAARSAAVYAQLYRSRSTLGAVQRRGEAYEALGICLADTRAGRREDRGALHARISRLMLEAGQAGREAHGHPDRPDAEARERFLDCVYDICLEAVAALAACSPTAHVTVP